MSRTRLRTKVYGKWILARRRFPTDEEGCFDIGGEDTIDMEEVYLILHFPSLFSKKESSLVRNLFRVVGQ